MPNAKKQAKPVAKGAKAPQASPRLIMSGEDLRDLAKCVALYLNATREGPLVNRSENGPATSPEPSYNSKLSEPATAPYKSRLQNLVGSAMELLQKQQQFEDYLNPSSKEAGATAADPSSSVDELFSTLEYLMERNHSMIDKFRSQF